MKDVKIRAHFATDVEGECPAEQTLLALIRKRLAQRHYDTISLSDQVQSGGRVYLFVNKEPGEVHYRFNEGSAPILPEELRVLTPLRVTLAASGHFCFPDAAIYKNGAEVIWSQRVVNAFYPDQQPVIQNTWRLSLTTDTVQEAIGHYLSIRTGEAEILHRWVNRRPESVPERSGSRLTTGAFASMLCDAGLGNEMSFARD
jgi:hypothetical protein